MEMSDRRDYGLSEERKLYNIVCSKQFDELKRETHRLADQVGEINKKVFNGFETKIENTALAVAHTDEKLEQMRQDHKKAHDDIKASIQGTNRWMVRVLIALLILLLGAGVDIFLGRRVSTTRRTDETSTARTEG